MLDKIFNPEQLDGKFYNEQEQTGYFAPSGQGEPYCIMLPPPNVTGSLHMGHALQQTLMDILIRYHRLQGYNTLWQGGTDHAGIATQMIVERLLEQEGIDKKSLTREQLMARVWQWKEESGSSISKQMRKLGASIDWSRERFTLDPGLSEAVQKVFIELYHEGLIYRGERLVNWDPILKTALSDVEVELHEEAGKLWHINYLIVGGEDYITVATTRPETIFGDMAVAVNPLDSRYAHLIGKEVVLPISNRLIPIIGDSSVEITFGTGCVKITPAHDFNDYQIAKRHNLAFMSILTEDGKLNELVPAHYQGLDRFVARKKLIQELTELNLVPHIEDYTVKLPKGDRSGAVLEPRLTKQWFVNMQPLAKEALAVVKEGRINFYPKHWENTYFDWLNKIEDWCISRQIWWGHRIPAWYDDAGNCYVGKNEEEIRKKYNITTSLAQDNDVLDTWFSSALWPFSTLGWPDNTKELNIFYPTSTLVTGFDIIFFWVARMIMFGLKFMHEVPFKKIYINGIVVDNNGQKMSKTKGNVLDPLDLIHGITLEELLKKRTHGLMNPKIKEQIIKNTTKEYPEGIAAHGVDALRFSFCQLATPSRFIKFDLQKLILSKHFCNKLWNAARFVLMNIGANRIALTDVKLHIIDEYFLSKWQLVKQELAQHLDNFRFDLFAETIHNFVWQEFCDWHLEFSKTLNQDNEYQRGNHATLYYLLKEISITLSIVMPFICEEIHLELTGNPIKEYPQIDSTLINEEAINEITSLQQLITSVRNIRGENKIAPNTKINLLLQKPAPFINKYLAFIQSLAKVEQVIITEELPLLTASTISNNIEIFVPLAEVMDLKAEAERLTKEINSLTKELLKLEQKLANENYKSRAPAALVNSEQQRVAELKELINNYQQKLSRL